MSLLYLRTATIFNCGCEVACLSAPISLCVIFLNFYLTFVSRSYLCRYEWCTSGQGHKALWGCTAFTWWREHIKRRRADNRFLSVIGSASLRPAVLIWLWSCFGCSREIPLCTLGNRVSVESGWNHLESLSEFSHHNMDNARTYIWTYGLLLWGDTE